VRHDNGAREYGKKASIELVAGAAGFLGPPGVVAAALARPALERLLLRGQQNAMERVSLLVEYVTEQVGMTSEDFASWAEGKEERRILTESAFAAAFDARTTRKVLWLARVLVDNVGDDAKLELSSLMVPAIAALEPPHIRVLEAIDSRPPLVGNNPDQGHRKWDAHTLGEQLPGLVQAIDLILTVLQSNGFVQSGKREDNGGLITLVTTPFGRQAVAYLHEVDFSAAGNPLHR
jgi:hypothetical protein